MSFDVFQTSIAFFWFRCHPLGPAVIFTYCFILAYYILWCFFISKRCLTTYVSYFVICPFYFFYAFSFQILKVEPLTKRTKTTASHRLFVGLTKSGRTGQSRFWTLALNFSLDVGKRLFNESITLLVVENETVSKQGLFVDNLDTWGKHYFKNWPSYFKKRYVMYHPFLRSKWFNHFCSQKWMPYSIFQNLRYVWKYNVKIVLYRSYRFFLFWTECTSVHPIQHCKQTSIND